MHAVVDDELERLEKGKIITPVDSTKPIGRLESSFVRAIVMFEYVVIIRPG